jgi:predicted acyl esterase
MPRPVRTISAVGATLAAAAAAAVTILSGPVLSGPVLSGPVLSSTAPSTTAHTGAAPAAGPSFGHYDPQPEFTERVTESFYLPMRDGARLAVRLDRPAVAGEPAPGPFPVLWHHTLSIDNAEEDGASGDGTGGFAEMPSLTEHGYEVAQVARRGNGQSFGVRRGYNDRVQAHDAYEVTE